MVQLEQAPAPTGAGRRAMWVTNPVVSVLLFIGIFGFVLFVLIRLRVCVADDAYIHERITEHLLRFGQPWFNPGERVMSTSSPIWNLLLAGVFTVLPGWYRIPLIEALSTSVTVLCAVALVRATPSGNRDRRAWAAVAYIAVVIASLCLLIPVAAEQMETAFAVALLACAAVLLDRRPGFALAILVVAGFVRYEIVGCLILAVAYLAFQRRLKSPSAAWTYPDSRGDSDVACVELPYRCAQHDSRQETGLHHKYVGG